MRLLSQTRGLLYTTSVVALSAAALMGVQPARAANTINQAIYAGGSTLASQAFRQLFDCYMGQTVGTGTLADGFSFSAAFTTSPPSPGLLPAGCLTSTTAVEGLYAGVGSGNGFRGYISDNPTEWYGGTVSVGNTFTAPPLSAQPPFPAVLPPFIDNNNANFGSYPYPHVDIGLSDSPLPTTLTTTAPAFTPTTNWQSAASIQVTAAPTTTFSTSSWGPAIQIPAFEVAVGVMINTAAPSTTTVSWNIQSNIGLSGAGSAVQLTEAQLCAIFSGLVTDWSDTTTLIPVMTGAGSLNSENFFYANTDNTAGSGAAAYVTGGSLPITVVFRADGSGTSFILTNYLQQVCPLIDGNTHGYQQIFAPTAADISAGYKPLPNTTFANLQSNVEKFRTANGNSLAGTNWKSATASGGVAATVSDATGQPNNAGFIGYVSADFTSPYADTVTGIPAGSTTPVTVDAPQTASLQNENLRASHGVDVPGQMVGGVAQNFIAPGPAAADVPWQDGALFTTLSQTSTANDWNVYNQVFPGTQPSQAGYTVAGHGILPLTLGTGAYPLSGTTFLALYSCYNTAARATNVVNFLKWLYNANANVTGIIQNSGFNPLSPTFASLIKNGYLAGTQSNSITDAATHGGLHGCHNVTGGAN